MFHVLSVSDSTGTGDIVCFCNGWLWRNKRRVRDEGWVDSYGSSLKERGIGVVSGGSAAVVPVECLSLAVSVRLCVAGRGLAKADL